MAENSGDLSLGYMMGQSDGNNGGFGGGMWEGIWGIVLLAMVLGWGNGGFGGFGGVGASGAHGIQSRMPGSESPHPVPGP